MITVDTQIIIWHALKPEMLSRRAKKEIENANKTDGMIFCDISFWEIAMLIKKERLKIDLPFTDFIKLLKIVNKYNFQRITPEVAELSTKLPIEINKDPADRIICAVSLLSNTSLLTSDKNIRQSKIIDTIW